MTGNRDIEITEALLHAYADGNASAEERVAVERYLSAHPDRAADVAHWQRQNEALTALYPAIANETRPDRLNPHHIARYVANGRWQSLSRIAAVLVLFVLGGVVGWGLRDVATPTIAASDVLIESAVTAHLLYAGENRHAVEVAAADRDHLVTWLSNRVTRPVTPPDLTAEGFTFVGGRLLPTSDRAGVGPAAQLMYEDAAGERLTLFITAALPDGADAYQFASRASLEAFYWANDTITCTVVGGLAADEMQPLARRIYQQLTRRPDASTPAYQR